ncbi:DBH-like monooxygenase protein 1 [Oscarella lobularis]|uniref:DBH-like monooxygenase protein 1 n=1 Tax=Oscarella lobularis TaxID=121494 RepID=UPI003313CF94
MRPSFVTLAVCTICALATGAILPNDFLINKYTFHVSLDENENYWLFWSVDNEAGEISFGVQVNTPGWIGFGLSPDGRMPNSDIMTGWVNSKGKGFIQDRYSSGKFLPSDAESQDVELIAASEADQVTTLEFKRKLKACEANDRSIDIGTSRIIWSYNPNDPEDDSPSALLQHTVTGRRSVNLLDTIGGAQVPLPDDVQELIVGVRNVHLPTSETTYWCRNFTMPVIPSGAHIVGYAPMVTPGNEGVVHHIVIYRCFNGTVFSTGYEGNCYGNMLDEHFRCRGTAPVVAWGIGGSEIRYPADVGYPFSGDSGLQSVIFEVHYDNPQQKSNIYDSSGIKLYYTTSLRKKEATSMQFAHQVSSSLILPKGGKNIVTTNLCPAECTQKGIPESGINVFGVFLHAHTAAIAVKLRHIRNGKELPNIGRNDHYDFDYQDTVFPLEPIKIFPGDILQTICHYNTENRTKVTIGGEGTRDEMCFAFLLVYPAPKLFSCYSQVPKRELNEFIAKAYTKGWASPYTGDTMPQLINGLNKLDLSIPSAAGEAYDALWNTTKRRAFCMGHDSDIIARGEYSLPSYVPLAPDPPPVCSTEAKTVLSVFSIVMCVVVLVVF